MLPAGTVLICRQDYPREASETRNCLVRKTKANLGPYYTNCEVGISPWAGLGGHWRATDQYDTQEQVSPKEAICIDNRGQSGKVKGLLLASDWGQRGSRLGIEGDGLDDCEAVHGDSALS